MGGKRDRCSWSQTTLSLCLVYPLLACRIRSYLGHTRHLITLASMLMILSLIHEQKPVLETLSLKCWVSIGYFTFHSVPLVHLPTPDFMFRLKLVWKQWFLTSFSRDSFNCLRMSLIGPSRVHFCAFEKLARWLCVRTWTAQGDQNLQ